MMRLTSEIIDKYFDFYYSADKYEFKYKTKNLEIRPDAFKNCRNRQIRSLHLKSKDEFKKDNQTTFNGNHSSVFEPLKEHLEELTLTCSWNCDFNFLEHLGKLKKLSLKSSAFFNANPMFNAANNQLTHLDLSYCKLQIGDKTMFNDLKCLKHLDLSKVTLANNVLPELFSELKQLDTLKLINTELTLAEDAFIHQENLKELHFVGIEIPLECTNILAPLKSLQTLIMGATKTLNYDAFRQVKDLRQLKLSHFATIEIGENLFDQHPNLDSLHLSSLEMFDSFITFHFIDLSFQSRKSEKYCIDLKALSNLKSLKSLNLGNTNLNIDEDYEMIFSLANLEHLDLSLSNREMFLKRELKLNETTFERMKKLKILDLSFNRIKLEGNCFKHLPQLRELDLSNTILDSNNNDYDIFSSLKQLEKFTFKYIEPFELFKLYRMSELDNLKELHLMISESDLEQYREMLRSKRRQEEQVEPPNPDPTVDDLCYFILKNLTKLKELYLLHSDLTYLNKDVISQMKDLSTLMFLETNIQHIPDDTFDYLANLDTIIFFSNHLRPVKLNRLFLKCDKLKVVSFDEEPIVDLMDEQFNFKSLVNISCGKYSNHLEKFYVSRKVLLQQNQISISSSLPASKSKMKSVEIMFERIDFKLNAIKSEKEKSIEQQLKPFVVDQIQLEPIEDKLNQVRQEMIEKLKEIHDKSINEITGIFKKYKQPNHWINQSIREESLREASQCAEKILKSQLKLPTSSYSNLPKLSNFFKLMYSNTFKGMKLVKYLDFLPELLSDLHREKKFTIPINKTKFLVLRAPNDSFNIYDSKYSDKCLFEIYDDHTGFISSQQFDDNPSDISSTNSLIDTFSIVNDHLVTVRKNDVKDVNDYISKFQPERLETNCLTSIEGDDESSESVSCIQLIDVYDLYLNKISQATVKSYGSNEASVYTCGNAGVLVQSRIKINQNVSHYLALYSLKMKLKRKRIRVDFELTTHSIKFKPIKFDDTKCFIYKHTGLEYSSSIAIYSFIDSTLIQEFEICIPLQENIYHLMAIDSKYYDLYFTSSISQTIYCYNLLTKGLVKSHIPELIFNKLILANDERLLLNTTENILFNLEDNFHSAKKRIELIVVE